jgi:hypothetical protein
MCRICEGATWEEVFEADATRIAVYGYVLIGVEAREPWVYTAGLCDSADHPEFLLAGRELSESSRVLKWLAESVIAGARYQAGDVVCTPFAFTRLDVVEETEHRPDTFAMWHQFRAADVLLSPDLTALQVTIVASFSSGESKAHPNRAERRRRKRKSHE